MSKLSDFIGGGLGGSLPLSKMLSKNGVDLDVSNTFTAPSKGVVLILAFAAGGSAGYVRKSGTSFYGYVGRTGGNTTISGEGWEIVLGGGAGGRTTMSGSNVSPEPGVSSVVGLPDEVSKGVTIIEGPLKAHPGLFTNRWRSTIGTYPSRGGGGGGIHHGLEGSSVAGDIGDYGGDGGNVTAGSTAIGGKGGACLLWASIPVAEAETVVFTLGARRGSSYGDMGSDGYAHYIFWSDQEIRDLA